MCFRPLNAFRRQIAILKRYPLVYLALWINCIPEDGQDLLAVHPLSSYGPRGRTTISRAVARVALHRGSAVRMADRRRDAQRGRQQLRSVAGLAGRPSSTAPPAR